MCNANSTDQYKASLPEIKLDTNAGRQRELQSARQVRHKGFVGTKTVHDAALCSFAGHFSFAQLSQCSLFQVCPC